MALTEVAKFSDLMEAEVVATALRSAGMAVLIRNEHLGQPQFAFAVSVAEEDAFAARAFLNETRPAGA